MSFDDLFPRERPNKTLQRRGSCDAGGPGWRRSKICDSCVILSGPRSCYFHTRSECRVAWPITASTVSMNPQNFRASSRVKLSLSAWSVLLLNASTMPLQMLWNPFCSAGSELTSSTALDGSGLSAYKIFRLHVGDAGLSGIAVGWRLSGQPARHSLRRLALPHTIFLLAYKPLADDVLVISGSVTSVTELCDQPRVRPNRDSLLAMLRSPTS